MTKITLYEIPLRKHRQDWVRKFRLRDKDNIRSKIVYKCKICHTKTNKVTISKWNWKGYPHFDTYYTEIYCPGRTKYEEKHDVIEASLYSLRDLEEQIEYNKIILKYSPQINQAIATKTMNNIADQKRLLNGVIDNLRKRLSERRLDDIVGLNDNPIIKEYDLFVGI